MQAVTIKNAALNRANYYNLNRATVQGKPSARMVAMTAERAGDGTAVEEEAKKGQINTRTIWISFFVALGIGLLVLWAIKTKVL